MIGHYSMVSPMPGNTPPSYQGEPQINASQKEFKMIEDYLRQNNIPPKGQEIPQSKNLSSRVGSGTEYNNGGL